jgi:23S rRNA (uracil1939-C5)-methyltransferase
MRNKKAYITPAIPAEVHGMTHEGRGIAAVNEKTTFIEGALPTEKVIYRIFKARRHFDEAAVV